MSSLSEQLREIQDDGLCDLCLITIVSDAEALESDLAEVTAQRDALKAERATIFSENEALKNARNGDRILKERDYWSRRAEKAEAELEATKTAYAHMVKLKDELCSELEAARKSPTL